MKKAVILCAGGGRRLRPLTEHQPKAMLPINNHPLLEHHLLHLKRYGITDIYINLHYLPDRIQQYFGAGETIGLHISYAYEPKLRGTAGALNGFRIALTETFAVQYGDVISELNIDRMLSFHLKRNSVATLVVQPTRRPYDCDIVEVDAEDRVTAVHQVPGTTAYGVFGNSAFYILEPKVLDYLPEVGEYDFVKDIFPMLLANNEPVYAYLTDDYLEDIGTLERYERVRKRYESVRSRQTSATI